MGGTSLIMRVKRLDIYVYIYRGRYMCVDVILSVNAYAYVFAYVSPPPPLSLDFLTLVESLEVMLKASACAYAE